MFISNNELHGGGLVVREQIGRGAYADVYLCTFLGNDAALKVTPAALSPGAQGSSGRHGGRPGGVYHVNVPVP